MTVVTAVPGKRFHGDFCTQMPTCRHLTNEPGGSYIRVDTSVLKVSVFIFQVFS